MSELTPLECVRALTVPVSDLGSRWMFHPDTLAAAKAAGYPNGFLFYFAGRGGVLGDVDADVVVAGFGYFEPALVRKVWEGAIAVEGARTAGHRFAEACAAWGRVRLGGVAGMDRLADLAERVIDGVDVPGLSLFAGWRAEPRPADAAGRAFLAMHVLRELRGSVHIVATTAQGLTALEAMLAAPMAGGPERAKQFGWAEPYPDPAVFADRRAAAEDQTDHLLARHYEVLTAAERGELVELVSVLRTTLDT